MDAKTDLICPLCGSAQARVFTELKTFEVGVRYYICERCGFVYQNAAESMAGNPEFYTKTYRQLYQQNEKPTAKDLRQQRLRAEEVVRFLKENSFSPKRALDIGASSGLLLKTMQNAFDCEVAGVEPGEAYRAEAASRGLPMFVSIQELKKAQPAKFDQISLMHVLEHLNDPVGQLRDLREKVLSDEGYLLIEVPNLYCHDSFELAHLSCFSAHTLRETLRKAGYKIVALKKHGMPRSRILQLYLTVIAKPARSNNDKMSVNPEKYVILKRSLGLFCRKAITRLMPKLSWLPMEDK